MTTTLQPNYVSYSVSALKIHFSKALEDEQAKLDKHADSALLGAYYKSACDNLEFVVGHLDRLQTQGHSELRTPRPISETSPQDTLSEQIKRNQACPVGRTLG